MNTIKKAEIRHKPGTVNCYAEIALLAVIFAYSIIGSAIVLPSAATAIFMGIELFLTCVIVLAIIRSVTVLTLAYLQK